MRLQTDPTIIYGLGDDYNGTIRRTHLTDGNNPYNTYVQLHGLPPTPISMPSMPSLEAAAHPAKPTISSLLLMAMVDTLLPPTILIIDRQLIITVNYYVAVTKIRWIA
ncbi:endolytic transglycosylase MltG [Orbaceae bacterium ESL0721]|nr:endolytic transglycosylase MltG [Orbaceae bacterium ESL0721]